MSDVKDNEILDEVKLAGEQKLEMRVNRLKRLMELGAPPVVIAHEVILVEKAMWLFDPTSMAAAIETDRVKSAKKAAGFCVGLNCQNSRNSDAEYCESCLKEDVDEGDRCNVDGCTNPCALNENFCQDCIDNEHDVTQMEEGR